MLEIFILDSNVFSISKCQPDFGAPPMGGLTMGWLGGAGSLGGGGAFLSEPYCLTPDGGDDEGRGRGLLWMPILGLATDRLLLLLVRRTVLTLAGPAKPHCKLIAIKGKSQIGIYVLEFAGSPGPMETTSTFPEGFIVGLSPIPCSNLTVRSPPPPQPSFFTLNSVLKIKVIIR